MATTSEKTVRFTRVVERSGQPRVHTLWLPPEKDPEFKRALTAHRVMSIRSAPGKTDVGTVGAPTGGKKGGQFLIFPKSLKRFEGARVVGIKFDLLEASALVPATAPKRRAPQRRRGKKMVTRKRPSANERSARESRHEPARPTPHQTKPEPKHEEARRGADESAEAALSALRKEVRAAMRELEEGKAVAAHRRLERAVS